MTKSKLDKLILMFYVQLRNKMSKTTRGIHNFDILLFFFFNKPELCIRKRHERFIDINVSNSDF